MLNLYSRWQIFKLSWILYKYSSIGVVLEICRVKASIFPVCTHSVTGCKKNKEKKRKKKKERQTRNNAKGERV